MKKLDFLSRYLTLWIFLAMATGIGIGYLFPGVADNLQSYSTGTTNIPLAVGLILMMYPPLVKVRFEKIPMVFSNLKLLAISFFITWIIGPFLMFMLGVAFLSNYPGYLEGLILVGIAPCIAMVIVWNELADGNREYIAGLVGINSLLQVFFYSVYAWFYLEVMLPLFGISGVDLDITIAEIAKTVGIYLGIPFLAAVISRYTLIGLKGADWLNRVYLKVISPVTLAALLFTIIVMFSLKGRMIVQIPGHVGLIAIPLVLFFILMFVLTFFVSKKMGADYPENAAVSFTATGNNFELAIAVAIGVFGINSEQAFAGVVGPLVEVPVLILLVKLAFFLRRKFYKTAVETAI